MLDLKSPVPLYVQLREMLRQQIESGVYAPGDQIPGEPEMVRQFGVARATVRQAIGDLVNEGVLFRKQGKGTFVCRTRSSDAIEPLISFSAEMTDRGLTPGGVVLCHEKAREIPSPARELLSAAPSVFYLERLRTADGVPLALEYSYLDEEITPGLAEEDLTGSLYQLLVHRRQVPVEKSVQSIGSALASSDEATRLQIQPGDPILLIERTLYTTGNRPFYWLKFVFRGDLYRLHTVMEKPVKP
ncbi:MAG: GntR family transcriptional regulator [Solirubrobacterales bacterium]